MALLETLTIGVGAAVAKTVLKRWLEDSDFAEAVGVEIVDILIKAGADKRMQDKFDKAPLDYCKMFSEETKYGAFPSLFECFECAQIPGNPATQKRARATMSALIPFNPPRVKRIRNPRILHAR